MKEIKIEELKEIQLSILDNIDNFCRNNNIKYILTYGTLIGAIRHNGYIPWDDDIDISMPRPDYERFIELYNSQNVSYKVINHTISNDYMLPFAKVTDTRTIIHETMYEQDDYGVFIDVFPLDGVKNNNQFKMSSILGKLLNTKKAKISKSRNLVKNSIILVGKIILLFTSIDYILSRIQKVATQIEYDKSDNVANIVSSYGPCEIINKSLISETEEHSFEGHNYMIPKGYDTYLRNIYGDYMQLPPINKRISTHTFVAWWKHTEEKEVL